eukprot:Seg3589.1 transcript_id=Seg3589.1/GoldUCD/mRNA.D3Y31 product="hypothetical protein" protein_id=Seg3589.1/GoldUCD/D3Y31
MRRAIPQHRDRPSRSGQLQSLAALRQTHVPSVLSKYSKATVGSKRSYPIDANPGYKIESALAPPTSLEHPKQRTYDPLRHAEHKRRKIRALLRCQTSLPNPRDGFNNNHGRNMTPAEILAYARELEAHKSDGNTRDVSFLRGSGLMNANPNYHDIIGSQAPLSNQDVSNTPQLEGKRAMGGTQPGFEKFLYNPTVKVSDFIESTAEIEISAHPINPAFGTSVHMTIPQQAPGFLDSTAFWFEFYLQAYNGDNVIGTAPGKTHITFVNNIAASIWKNISFIINNQNIELANNNYMFKDWFECTYYTEQNAYEKGDFVDQGYIFEPIGEMLNATVTVTDGVADCANPKTKYFYNTLLSGEKIKLRFTPKAPFIKAKIAKSLANKIDIVLTRNSDSLLVFADQDLTHYTEGSQDAKEAARRTATNLAKNIRLSITDFKLRFNRLELVPHELEKYIHTYSMESPDTFYFTHHDIRNISINRNAQTIREPLPYDSIPDQIFVTVVDKNAVIGSVETYPFMTFPIPHNGDGEFLLELLINSQSWRANPVKDNKDSSQIKRSIIQKIYQSTAASRSNSHR